MNQNFKTLSTDGLKKLNNFVHKKIDMELIEAGLSELSWEQRQDIEANMAEAVLGFDFQTESLVIPYVLPVSGKVLTCQFFETEVVKVRESVKDLKAKVRAHKYRFHGENLTLFVTDLDRAKTLVDWFINAPSMSNYYPINCANFKEVVTFNADECRYGYEVELFVSKY